MVRTELVRVCGVIYRVNMSEGPMGEPEIVSVNIMGEDGIPAGCLKLEENWADLLNQDHVDAILMAVEDGNFLRTK